MKAKLFPSISRLLLSAVFIALSACQVAPIAPTDHTRIEWNQHVEQISLITEWSLQAKVGIRNAAQQGSSLSAQWHQVGKQYTLRLYGSLGQGMTILESNGRSVHLRAPNIDARGTDAELLLAKHTGWKLPLSHATDWIRGIPSPNTPIDKMKLSTNGLLEELQQAGWTIRYEAYQLVDNIWLPEKITLMHPEVQVKIVIKSWE